MENRLENILKRYKFKVNEFRDRDDDENQYDHIIPFNLSYAISIHKAQGLEFNSVKIIIFKSYFNFYAILSLIIYPFIIIMKPYFIFFNIRII